MTPHPSMGSRFLQFELRDPSCSEDGTIKGNRPFDLYCSSDGGKTWALFPTTHTEVRPSEENVHWGDTMVIETFMSVALDARTKATA